MPSEEPLRPPNNFHESSLLVSNEDKDQTRLLIALTTGELLTSEGLSISAIGRKIVDSIGTAVQLSSTSVAMKYVIIVAETDNTGLVIVGNQGVVANLTTRKGIPLDKGGSITVPDTNLTNVYIDAEVNGEGVTFMAFN